MDMSNPLTVVGIVLKNAEHEKWKRYQDERHDWEWERDRTIWKDGNEE